MILHGLYGSSDNWLSIGKSLSGQFTVHLVDQRNHGRSPHDPVHTYQAMRDDLRDFLDQHDLWKVNLIGHSMGGKTAMFFAAAFPHRLSSLVIVDISPRSYKSLVSPSPQALSHLNIVQSLLSLNLEEIGSRSGAENLLAETIPSHRVRQFLLKNLDRNPDGRFTWRLNLEVLAASLRSILDGFSEEAVKKGLKVTGFPVLFVRGEQSDYINKEDMEMAQNLFPEARFESIPQAGHWVHAEQPELFLAALNRFYELKD